MIKFKLCLVMSYTNNVLHTLLLMNLSSIFGSCVCIFWIWQNIGTFSKIIPVKSVKFCKIITSHTGLSELDQIFKVKAAFERLSCIFSSGSFVIKIKPYMNVAST